jgi:hypothetical protein
MVAPYGLIINLIGIFCIILLSANCFFSYVKLLFLLFDGILDGIVYAFVIVIIMVTNYLFMGKVGFKYDKLRFGGNIIHFKDRFWSGYRMMKIAFSIRLYFLVSL